MTVFVTFGTNSFSSAMSVNMSNPSLSLWGLVLGVENQWITALIANMLAMCRVDDTSDRRTGVARVSGRLLCLQTRVVSNCVRGCGLSIFALGISKLSFASGARKSQAYSRYRFVSSCVDCLPHCLQVHVIGTSHWVCFLLAV